MAGEFWKKTRDIIGMSLIGMGDPSAPMRLVQMKQQQQMAKLHLDAKFGTRGYERMDDDEIKDYVRNQYLSGYKLAPKQVDTPIGTISVDRGSVGLPEGATYKGGIIYDKKGSQIGEYMEGFEPKKMKQTSQSNGDVLNIQGNYYKWNPDLAKKMGREVPATPEELATMAEKLQGQFVPAYVKTGVGTYRYQPSQMERAGVQQQPYQQPQETPIITPTQQATPIMNLPNQEQGVMQRAIMNAIANKVPKDEIIKGIESEGFNPKDYQRILATYDPNIPVMRRNFLGNLLLGMGLAPTDQITSIMKAISGEIDKRKAVYSPTSKMLAQERGR